MESIFDTEHLQRSYFKMAFPIVLGMVVSLVYNLADTFFISQTGDTNLIAGVSLCSPVFTTLMAFGNVFGQGGSSLISRLMGEKDMNGTARVSSFCFYVSIATGVVLAIVMTAFNKPLLALLGANDETMPHALSYYTVLSVCSPIVVLSFIHSNLVRCEGMANESMIGSILGSIVNIILDPILISVCGMGAFGAAVATIIGYLSSVVYFLFVLKKKSHCLSVKPSDCRVNAQEVKQICGVGITAALSNLMQSMAVIVVNQYLLPYGNDKIAAMGIVLKISMIVLLILTGFAFGGVPIFGYLYGAGQAKELKKLIRFCLIFLSALSLALTAIICLFAQPLMSIFLSDSALIATGVVMLRWQAATSVFAGIVLLLTVLFQATGKIVPSFIMSISRQGVVFLLAIVVCVNLFAYNGVLMAQAVADVLSAILALVLLVFFSPMKGMKENASADKIQ